MLSVLNSYVSDFHWNIRVSRNTPEIIVVICRFNIVSICYQLITNRNSGGYAWFIGPSFTEEKVFSPKVYKRNERRLISRKKNKISAQKHNSMLRNNKVFTKYQCRLHNKIKECPQVSYHGKWVKKQKYHFQLVCITLSYQIHNFEQPKLTSPWTTSPASSSVPDWHSWPSMWRLKSSK